MASDASSLRCANSPLTLISCPQPAQISSAADAVGAESHIPAAISKSNIAWVAVRANAKTVSRADIFVLIFKSFVRQPGNAKFHRQFPLPPAGRTEISAALVQPLRLISCNAVKRKTRALTGANVTCWSDGLFRMLANVPETMLVVQLVPSGLVSKR